MDITTARRLVGQKIGLLDFNGSVDAYRGLTQTDQVRLTDALSQYIVMNPDSFTKDQVTVAASRVNSDQFGKPLLDTSFDYTQFTSDVAQNVSNLGSGILKGLGATQIIVGLIFVGYLVYKYGPKKS